MLRFSILTGLCVCACFAADSPKPPARVDKALRERISEFYQLHVNGEFRKAEALVAADTRDFYYTINKPKYLDYEIVSIDYSDHFTRAKAIVKCKEHVMAEGFNGVALPFNIPSNWKLEKGKWYWYVDQKAPVQTPFGMMFPPGGQATPQPPGMPADMTKGDFVFNQVKADRQSVDLAPGESAQVTFENHAAGPMKLEVLPKIKGIEISFDHAVINAGEKAVMTVKASEDAKAIIIPVIIEQTGETIPIQVNIK